MGFFIDCEVLFMLLFLFGLITGTMLFEPIIINFVYFSNIALFEDIILTKKNKNKLKNYYLESGVLNEKCKK